jgi:hypothetical protein
MASLFPRQMFFLDMHQQVTVTGFTFKDEGIMRCKMPDDTWRDIADIKLMELAEVHCCPKCGSTHIHYPVWQDPNSGEVGSWIEGSEGHCEQCTAMFSPTQTIKLLDYKLQQQQTVQ